MDNLLNLFQKGGEASRDTVKIKDTRDVRATTGKKINPKVDLLSGEYNAGLIRKIVGNAKMYDVDPYTAIAIAMQESMLDDSYGNVGHIADSRGLPTKGADSVEDFIMALKFKTGEYSDSLKIDKDNEELRLQAYNGLGIVRPSTEKWYHGYDMKKIYGVTIPKEGINMKENPLYGKQIKDIRDNIIKKNPDIQKIVKEQKPMVGTMPLDPSVLLNNYSIGNVLSTQQQALLNLQEGGAVKSTFVDDPVNLYQQLKDNGITELSYEDYNKKSFEAQREDFKKLADKINGPAQKKIDSLINAGGSLQEIIRRPLFVENVISDTTRTAPVILENSGRKFAAKKRPSGAKPKSEDAKINTNITNGYLSELIKMDKGGNINTTGYKDGTKTSKNPYNIIPSGNITMKGVSQPIMAFPQNGSPVLMMPDQDYVFDSSDFVLEVPLLILSKKTH